MRSLLVALSVFAAVAQGVSNCDPFLQGISVHGGQSVTVPFSGVPVGCVNPTVTAVTPMNGGGKLEFVGANIVVSDVPDEEKVSQGIVNLNCDGKVTCDRLIKLDITKAPVTVAPTPTAGPIIVSACGWTVGPFSTDVSSSVVGSITHSKLDKCAVTNFKVAGDAADLKGRIEVNAKGKIGYYASATPEQVKKTISVSCDGVPECNLAVWFEATAPMPTQSPPVTVAPPPKPAACPGRYYFNADHAVDMSATLAGHTTEPFCAGSRTFKVLKNTARGTLTNWPDGAFRYSPPSHNDEDSFSFQMECDGQFVCISEAVIFTRTVVSAPGTNAPVDYSGSEFQTCRGSCSMDAWANGPTAEDENKWDFGLKQSNGHSVGSVDVTWTSGALIINAYGTIGRLAERFPTFEKISAPAGSRFNGTEVLRQAAQSSLPFDAQCLNNQENVGLGSEVWKESGFGDRYRKGTSWYQKFGGVHDKCDTFANSCNYAPLLTPKKIQDATTGTWSVDINNCDVTWKGQFPYAALLEQKKSDGSLVWKTTADRRLQATLYSESVKPTRWVDVAAGVSTQTEVYNLSVKLSEWVSITKTDGGNAGSNPFTLDPEFFEYTTQDGDHAFGLNMLFYPEATENVGGRTNFAADRRVHGFRVLKQSWVTPSDAQCPTCKNTGKNCKVAASQDSDELFVASGIQDMTCDSGAEPIITLTKGPSTASDACETDTFEPATNLVVDRAGFSKPSNCARTFQNLTLRGLAKGSNTAGAFDFEGSIQVQLLLSNGNRATINVNISMFVSMLSTNSHTEDANVEMCRSSPYFPVFDPLGDSLPDARHHLSASLPVGVQSHLCVDQLDHDFGPEGWAVLGFDVTKKSNDSSVRVEQFGMRYPGSNGAIMMVYNDAVTGAPVPVPTVVGSSWKETHPFLNFRDITSRAKNQTITSPSGPVMTGADFAFAFMPGSINQEVDLDVFCVVAVLNTKGEVISRPVLRQRIKVDPILTAESRNGPERVADVEDVVEAENPFFFFATSGVIIAVIALAAIAISNGMLPVGKKKSAN